LGYQMATIGGNIAQCKRALHHSNRTMELLQEIRGFLDQTKYLELDELALETRSAIGLHILDLRKKLNSH